MGDPRSGEDELARLAVRGVIASIGGDYSNAAMFQTSDCALLIDRIAREAIKALDEIVWAVNRGMIPWLTSSTMPASSRSTISAWRGFVAGWIFPINRRRAKFQLMSGTTCSWS